MPDREVYNSPLGIRSLVDHSAVGLDDHVSRLAEAVAALDEAGGTEDDPRWDDLRVSLARTQSAAGSPTYTTFKGTALAWQFQTGDAVGFDCQLPHDALLGAGQVVRPHLHWSPGNNTSTGSVHWQLDVEWANPVNEPDNEFVTLSGSPLSGAQVGAGVAYRHQIATFGDVDATLFRASTVLMCRLSRVASGDTFVGNPFALSVDWHYQRYRAGTDDEYPTA